MSLELQLLGPDRPRFSRSVVRVLLMPKVNKTSQSAAKWLNQVDFSIFQNFAGEINGNNYPS